MGPLEQTLGVYIMSDSTELQQGEYSGSDRRNSERRTGKDQREMIRFELDKEDRRSGHDRRQSNESWDSDPI